MFFLVHANILLNMVVLENTIQDGDFLKLQPACWCGQCKLRVCSCHYLNLRVATAVYMYCACAINCLCLLSIVMSSILTDVVRLVLLQRYYVPLFLIHTQFKEHRKHQLCSRPSRTSRWWDSFAQKGSQYTPAQSSYHVWCDRLITNNIFTTKWLCMWVFLTICVVMRAVKHTVYKYHSCGCLDGGEKIILKKYLHTYGHSLAYNNSNSDFSTNQLCSVT